METEEKKPEMKTEPKEEDESGGNSTPTTSTPQNRKKSKKTEHRPQLYTVCPLTAVNCSFVRLYCQVGFGTGL